MNVLQEIFRDHFEEMVYIQHPRQSVIENVEKMIGCGDWRKGHAVYACDKCGRIKIVPFRCKSRFCPTCGNKYNIQRATAMSFKIINVKHRHCVFTIAEELRHFFLEDRSLLNCLFHSVKDVVLNMFYKDNKSKHFTPGVICVLHTFGRDLKWNPHIHCLISEGGISDGMEWRKKDFFPYKLMRDSFQTVLLNRLEEKIGPSFKAIKSSIYRNHKNGFYVYAKPADLPPKDAIKYIGRYLGRPVIATSRIDDYDGDFVTFPYNRHGDDVPVTEKVPVMDFIGRLTMQVCPMGTSLNIASK